MQTSVVNAAGNYTDLLSGILNVQVKNEDKIMKQDRLYCQNQQDLLYDTLDQIDHWYSIFKENAEQYKEERKFTYDDNGKISMTDFHSYIMNQFRLNLTVRDKTEYFCNAKNKIRSISKSVRK